MMRRYAFCFTHLRRATSQRTLLRIGSSRKSPATSQPDAQKNPCLSQMQLYILCGQRRSFSANGDGTKSSPPKKPDTTQDSVSEEKTEPTPPVESQPGAESSAQGQSSDDANKGSSSTESNGVQTDQTKKLEEAMSKKPKPKKLQSLGGGGDGNGGRGEPPNGNGSGWNYGVVIGLIGVMFGIHERWVRRKEERHYDAQDRETRKVIAKKLAMPVTDALEDLKGKYYSRPSVEKEVSDWMKSSKRGLVVLGGNGSGKTTLLNMLWSQADKTSVPHDECPPVFIPFQDEYVVVCVDADGIIKGDEIRTQFEMTNESDRTVGKAVLAVMEKEYPGKRLIIYLHVKSHGENFKQSSFVGLWDSARNTCTAIPRSRWVIELSNDFMSEESGGIALRTKKIEVPLLTDSETVSYATKYLEKPEYISFIDEGKKKKKKKIVNEFSFMTKSLEDANEILKKIGGRLGTVAENSVADIHTEFKWTEIYEALKDSNMEKKKVLKEVYRIFFNDSGWDGLSIVRVSKILAEQELNKHGDWYRLVEDWIGYDERKKMYCCQNRILKAVLDEILEGVDGFEKVELAAEDYDELPEEEANDDPDV